MLSRPFSRRATRGERSEFRRAILGFGAALGVTAALGLGLYLSRLEAVDNLRLALARGLAAVARQEIRANRDDELTALSARRAWMFDEQGGGHSRPFVYAGLQAVSDLPTFANRIHPGLGRVVAISHDGTSFLLQEHDVPVPTVRKVLAGSRPAPPRRRPPKAFPSRDPREAAVSPSSRVALIAGDHGLLLL